MTSKVKNHIHYEWWGYLLIIALACLIWIPAFNAATKPLRSETVSVSFIGQGCDTRAMKNALAERLPELSEQEIKQVSVSSTSIDDFLSPQTLFSVSDQADLIIMTEDNIKEDTVSFYFDCVKDEELLLGFTAGAEYYRIDGAVVGVKIGGEGMENNFMKYYGGTQACYCFFGYKSENLKMLNGVGAEQQDAALQTLVWLLAKE